MYLLLWVVVGLFGGWLAGRSLEGNGYGPSMDAIMGIGGAIVGGLLISFAGFAGSWKLIFSIFAAMSCAALSTTLAGLINGRRIYSRPLWVSADRSNR
jgi:uncharacterized membrane protein YeaQ/YmgE (transglycosylase-associated protein family)